MSLLAVECLASTQGSADEQHQSDDEKSAEDRSSNPHVAKRKECHQPAKQDAESCIEDNSKRTLFLRWLASEVFQVRPNAGVKRPRYAVRLDAVLGLPV